MRVPKLTARSIEKLPALAIGKAEYLDGSVPGDAFGRRKWPTQRSLLRVLPVRRKAPTSSIGFFPTMTPEGVRKMIKDDPSNP